MILIKQEQLQNQINQISKEYNDRNILNIGGMCVGYLKEVIKKLQNLSIKAKELLQIQQEISNIQREIQLIELKKSYNQLLHNQQQLLNNKDQLITNSRQVQVFAEHLFQQLNQTDAEVIQLIQQLSQLTIKKNKTS
ncbi:unnamed protein product [Paramecium sonneborni]|uniref:Uncharacterized protein n=1 Tax=Paramecium sonneborni TaxID=65129 RepID=A0A8S1QJH3_9CILI|nr:unnamed protein product [Paramecium sonneborni]